MTERAYTASELNAILEQLRDSMGEGADVHLGFLASRYGGVPLVRMSLEIGGRARWVQGRTIEDALAKAHEAVVMTPKPDDAYAIIGVAAE